MDRFQVLLLVVYAVTTICSECRLEAVKFWLSTSYLSGLIFGLCVFCVVDVYWYRFTDAAFFVMSFIISSQVVAYVCRSYLWNVDSTWGQVVHGYVIDNQLYQPRSMSWIDCMALLVLGTYLTASVGTLRKLGRMVSTKV